jgi:hypothetical protein
MAEVQGPGSQMLWKKGKPNRCKTNVYKHTYRSVIYNCMLVNPSVMKITQAYFLDGTFTFLRARSPSSFTQVRFASCSFPNLSVSISLFKEEWLLSVLIIAWLSGRQRSSWSSRVTFAMSTQYLNSDWVSSHWKFRIHNSLLFEDRTLVISHGLSINGEKNRTPQPNLIWHLL